MIHESQPLIELEKQLTERGYKKYIQNHKNETFAYWKTFDERYQTGVLVYDWTKYDHIKNMQEDYGTQYECMILDKDSRCDMTVSKGITIEEFENMAEKFYLSMKVF